MENLEARIHVLETQNRSNDLDQIIRSHRRAGILQGLAFACLIYAIVSYVRGGNFEG